MLLDQILLSKFTQRVTVFFDRRRRKVAKRVELRFGSIGRSSCLDASTRDSDTEGSWSEYFAPCRTQGTFSDPEGGDAGHRTLIRYVSTFFFFLFHSIIKV